VLWFYCTSIFFLFCQIVYLYSLRYAIIKWLHSVFMHLCTWPLTRLHLHQRPMQSNTNTRPMQSNAPGFPSSSDLFFKDWRYFVSINVCDDRSRDPSALARPIRTFFLLRSSSPIECVRTSSLRGSSARPVAEPGWCEAMVGVPPSHRTVI
jgi:hypothetical protein